MLVLLPIVSFILLFTCNYARGNGIRKSFLLASVIYGILIVLSTESLSQFQIINAVSLSLFWSFTILIELVYYYLYCGKSLKCEINPIPLSPSLKILAAPVFAILSITFITAIVAPPNTWDSMTYHMSRIMHWMQHRSIMHYPTHYTPQLYQPPWAELSIMHLQILSGGDRYANLVQWFSMVGCLLGLSLIAQELGASQREQILVVIIAATIPMGILQASSTQNDYVVSFWLTTFIYFGILLKNNLDWRNTLFAGSSLGLSLLTKGTAYLFAFPFVLWFAFAGMIKYRRKIIAPAICVIVILIGINSGHYMRNYRVWGAPLTTDTDKITNERHGLSVLVSNMSRNALLHADTPLEFIDTFLYRTVDKLHSSMGVSTDAADTTHGKYAYTAQKYHEDFAGNPVHLGLVLIAVIIALFNMRKIDTQYVYYLTALIAGFIVYCLFIKWQPYGSRLQLPLFLLCSPLIAIALSLLKYKWIPNIVVVLLILFSVPYLLNNHSRPILNFYDDGHVHKSIFTTDRTAQYFYNRPYIESGYREIVSSIKRSACNDIALDIGEDQYEYPLWVLMQGSDNQIPHIEHVNVTNASKSITSTEFQPCIGINFRDPL